MGTTLSTLAPNEGATKQAKRIGRGTGTGIGKTGGRGTKGQKARAGHHGSKVGFEGGQMPMQRRLPKRGFANPFRVEAHPVNVAMLEKRFDDGEIIEIHTLRRAGLVPKKARVIKILGVGELTKKLTVRAHRFSKSARDKIEKAGGTVEVVAPTTAREKTENRQAAD